MIGSVKGIIIKYHNIFIILMVFIMMLLVLYPMAFKALEPGGVDVIGAKGRTHQLLEYEQKTGETVLWNQPVFSGMPIYHRLGGKVFSLDNLISKTLGRILYLNIWIYFIGFIGMFYLLRFLGLNRWTALFGGLAFIFLPYYMSMLSIGHFAKFRPIMYMPLVTMFFCKFLSTRKLLLLIGFIFSFSVQIRTQHYQIIFYQIMVLIVLGIFYLIKSFKQDKKVFFQKIILLAAASGLIIAMVAQPLFVTSEFTPYSIRGGTGESDSDGLTLDYATSWSLHPAETMTWFMPRFFGGISGELYDGSAVSQLKGRVIPGYWGNMPFTQSYDYIGIVLLFLAFLGLILNWRNNLIKTLSFLFVLALFLAFGRHFPLIYNFFFQNIPAFNKFRVPAMISVIMQIIIIIWAGFGLQSLFDLPEQKKKSTRKIIVVLTIVLLLISLLPQIIGPNLKLFRDEELSQYNQQTLRLIKDARLDMMQTDGWRMFFFVLFLGVITYLHSRKKMNINLLALLMIVILLIDLLPYLKKAEGKLLNPDILEKTHFRLTETDKYLLNDKSYFRVFPITENPFNTNDWSYYHNSIGGYSGAKLRIYQDIIENCLFQGTDTRLPVNWNILKMLNNKYIIANQSLNSDMLKLVFHDKRDELRTYEISENTHFAWFADNIAVIPDREKRFEALNDPNLDVYSTAILEKDPGFLVIPPDSTSIDLVEQSFNRISYDVFCDLPALLVVSEIYYPRGWICRIDGDPVEILKTNHILRSVWINEPGKHTVEFEFLPDTFIKLFRISLTGHLIAYFLLLIVIIRMILRKRVKSK